MLQFSLYGMLARFWFLFAFLFFFVFFAFFVFVFVFVFFTVFAFARNFLFHSDPSICEYGGSGPSMRPCHVGCVYDSPNIYFSSSIIHFRHRLLSLAQTAAHCFPLRRYSFNPVTAGSILNLLSLIITRALHPTPIHGSDIYLMP